MEYVNMPDIIFGISKPMDYEFCGIVTPTNTYEINGYGKRAIVYLKI